MFFSSLGVRTLDLDLDKILITHQLEGATLHILVFIYCCTDVHNTMSLYNRLTEQ